MKRRLYATHIVALSFFLMGLIADTSPQKTDLVILRNGDHITGEIIKMELKILHFNTNFMGTVQIRWDMVSEIVSSGKQFEILLSDDSRIKGSLDSISIENAIRLVTPGGAFNILMEDIASIYQFKQVFWRRFSGNLGAGVNYTKASQVLQYDLGADISYRDDNYSSKISFNSINTQRPDEPQTIKQDALANIDRRIRNAEFASLFLGAQRNSELGIRSRNMAGLAYGYRFLNTGISRFQATLGVTGNQEISTEDNSRMVNVEGFAGLDFRAVKYKNPELYIDSQFNYYPSMTVSGRHRFELEVKLRLELLSNIYLEIKFYDNYDSRPVSAEASTNDYGVLSGLSYSF